MFASASGVGKSVVALHIAMQLKLPVLYISADTSAHSMATRAFSMLSGESVNQVEQTLESDPGHYVPLISEHASHIFWDYRTTPSIDDILGEVESFAALHGDYPHLTVVDNLRNIYAQEDDTHAQQHACENLKTMAAETGSAVLVMHHLTGAFANGITSPDLSALENKCDKFPALIVGLSLGSYGDLRASILKNRYGNASGAGKLKTWISFSPAYMRVGA